MQANLIIVFTPFLHAYQHQFVILSPFCKQFEDKSYVHNEE